MYQDIFVYQDCVTYTCFRYQKRKSYVTDWLERGEWDQPRGGHLGIFWVGMCRPGLQIGTPF